MKSESVMEELNLSKKEKFLSVFKWFAPSLITILFIVVAMMINGVSPFGNNLIGYIDFDDGLVPAYNHLWDLFHGNANLFADWNLGGGSNAYASWAYFLFSPLDWLVAIFPRGKVANAIALVYIIKMALIAFSSYWLFRRLFKNTNNWVLTIMSVLWAFSGWMFAHYTNIGWLDIMILLPFFVYSLLELKEKRINWKYTLILAWMLLLSYYISYMLLLGVVVTTFIYFLVASEKGNRLKVLGQLFFGTIMAILISVGIFIPSCLTSLQAHRFTSDGTSAFEIGYFTNFFSKLALLVFYSLPIYLFYKLCFKFKNDKIARFFVIGFATLCLGLVIEPINMMWHTGSYYSFPFRYSYVLIFFLTLAGLYWVDKYCEKNSFFKEVGKKEKKSSTLVNVLILASATFISGAFICLIKYAGIFHPYTTLPFYVFLLYFLPCVFGVTVIFLAFRQNKEWFTKLAIILICFIQVMGYAFTFIGNSYGNYQQMLTSNVLKIDTDGIENNYRIKDRDKLYIANEALETRNPTLATWIHISSENQWQTHHRLGYHTRNTQLYDNGGTLFSDVLLGTRYVMSEYVLDDSVYTLKNNWEYDYLDNENKRNTKNVYLYEYKYYLPYIFAFNSDEISKDFEDKNPLEIQNWIYQKMFNKTDNIVKKLETGVTISSQADSEGYYTVNILNDTNSQFYVYGDVESVILGDTEYKMYDDALNDLGTYSNNLTMKIKSGDVSDLIFAKVEISELAAFVNSINSDYSYVTDNSNTIKITYNNSDGDKYLFVPLTYLNNYVVSVNGKIQDSVKALNGYLMISLVEGNNEIEITFVPQYMKICVLVSLISVLLFVAFLLLNHFFHLSEKKVISYIGTGGAIAIFAVVAFLIYLKPLIRFITGNF